MENQRLHELFEYIDGKLFWKVARGRINVGDEAGAVARNGRRYVQFDGKKMLVHRIIWEMHNANCPEFLDHIDRDHANNRIENLRPATKQENARNRSIRADNKTGFKGIYKHGKKFAASICVDGVNKFLGCFSTPEQAHAAYAASAKLNFKEFAHV